MTRRVHVKILPDGAVEADFVGFGGSDCLDEAERLAANLARFGIKVDGAQLRKKPLAEIEDETGTTEKTRDGVPTRR